MSPSVSALLAASLWPAARVPVLSSRSSFLDCPNDPPPESVKKRPPSCLATGGICEVGQDFVDLRQFASAVDVSLKEPLLKAKQARQAFERKVCDYRYAEIEEKGQQLVDTYGPDGPMSDGGSYLYDISKWADAIAMLHKSCGNSGNECPNLINYFRLHPEADVGAMGEHGRAGSEVFSELRMACEVGRTRSPVPNNSPMWCDNSTGLCAKRSCRQWWSEANPEQVEPRPWIDDRIEYQDLRDACAWVESKPPLAEDIKEFQRKLDMVGDDKKIQYCTPKWVDGYCPTKNLIEFHEPCILGTGQQCSNGIVIPSTEEDDTANWAEGFKEPTIKITMMPFIAPSLMPRLTQRKTRTWNPVTRLRKLSDFI